MRPILGILLLTLAACSPKVDSLNSWNGKSRDWLVGALGNPDRVDVRKHPIPNVGPAEFVTQNVERIMPGYEGGIEHCQWHKGRYIYDVYLIRQADEWRIVDSIKWRDDIAF